jgi:hypothetical protein
VLRLKIGLPKVRFTRKLLIISVGMLAVLGGSGAAALYVGADKLLEPQEESPVGGECTTIQTMVMKTPGKRLWLRKFVRMEGADGSARIKTALRVAGLLAKSNPVDLVQVSVLDAKGPDLRSAMRGRAIGADVVIALKPEYLPDMKEPFLVRYYEGMASEEGRYYGERVSLDLPEIKKLLTAMKSVPDKHDCAELEKPGDEAGAKKHGEQIVKESNSGGHGEKPAAHGEDAGAKDHGSPAHTEASAEGHEMPAKEQSFLDSALSLIGLGGSEEKPAEGHEAKAEDDSHAVAEEAIETSGEVKHEAEAPAEAHETPKEKEASAEGHETPAKEESFLDSVLNLVGLGGPEEKPAEDHEAKAEDDSHAVAEDMAEPSPDAKHEAEAAEHGKAPAEEPTAKSVQHESAETEDHGKAPATHH